MIFVSVLWLITLMKIAVAVSWTDCYHTTAQAYNGTTSQTWSGRQCQRWDVQTPHSHSFTDPSAFPDDNLSLANNYCRQPAGTGETRPWCYTTEDNVRWDYCFIYNCETMYTLEGENCYMMEPYEYNGQTDTTENSKDCQNWDSQSPHTHFYTDSKEYPDATLSDASNYCRNPDHALYSARPWCYTTDPNTRWQYCNISRC